MITLMHLWEWCADRILYLSLWCCWLHLVSGTQSCLSNEVSKMISFMTTSSDWLAPLTGSLVHICYGLLSSFNWTRFVWLVFLQLIPIWVGNLKFILAIEFICTRVFVYHSSMISFILFISGFTASLLLLLNLHSFWQLVRLLICIADFFHGNQNIDIYVCYHWILNYFSLQSRHRLSHFQRNIWASKFVCRLTILL